MNKNKLKILIVDDNFDIRLLAKAILRESYDFEEASNGKEALEIIDKDKDKEIALVLLDIMMPVMDGLRTMEKLKDIKKQRGIKVCFLTAKRDKFNVQKAVELGADDYIIKPIDDEILKAKIGTLLHVGGEDCGFAPIRTSLKATLSNVPIAVTLIIREISEYGVVVESQSMMFEGADFEIHCDKLSELLDVQGVIRLKCSSSEKDGNKYFVKTSFIGLCEKSLRNIRELAVNGKEIIDE